MFAHVPDLHLNIILFLIPYRVLEQGGSVLIFFLLRTTFLFPYSLAVRRRKRTDALVYLCFIKWEGGRRGKRRGIGGVGVGSRIFFVLLLLSGAFWMRGWCWGQSKNVWRTSWNGSSKIMLVFFLHICREKTNQEKSITFFFFFTTASFPK